MSWAKANTKLLWVHEIFVLVPLDIPSLACYAVRMIKKMSKLRTTTKYKDGDSLPPIHPGEILKSEFMEPLNLSATQLALHMGIPLSRVIMIVNSKRNLTADTAFRLAKVFKTSPEFWLSLQSQYEVAMLDYTGATEKICLEVREISSQSGLHRLK